MISYFAQAVEQLDRQACMLTTTLLNPPKMLDMVYLSPE